MASGFDQGSFESSSGVGFICVCMLNKLLKREYYPKMNFEKLELRSSDTPSTSKGGLKCFNRGGFGHETSECSSRTQGLRKRYWPRIVAMQERSEVLSTFTWWK